MIGLLLGQDSSFAMLMLNNGPVSANMTCDADCWNRSMLPSGAGAAKRQAPAPPPTLAGSSLLMTVAGRHLVVYDVWQHSVVGNATVGVPFSASVPALGGSVLYRMRWVY